MGKLKIEPGLICSFDPTNRYNNKEQSVDTVIVIKRLSWKPFGKSLWEVKDKENDNAPTMCCLERDLKPRNMCIVRYPADLPIFNDTDKVAIDSTIEFLEELFQLAKNDQPLIVGGKQFSTKDLKRLKAIKSKIDLGLSLREV